MTAPPFETKHHKGRGASFNPANRYSANHKEAIDDGWDSEHAEPEKLRTTLTKDTSRSVISYNQSPDVPFDRGLNPYRGCEHGCIYCYARPSHAWLGLSPGLDFESRLFYKPEIAELLSHELGKKGYSAAPMALGSNTDAYQPADRELQLSRQVLKVLSDSRHPVTIVTKSALVERDLDLLRKMAETNLAAVTISLTTLDPSLARRLEPRASAPMRRLDTVRKLSDAGIPAGVLTAPLIPGLTDSVLEDVLEKARSAGAQWAGYIMLRLPLEIGPMFRQWLERHYPEKAGRVMSLIQQTRSGKDNDTRFESRMRGEGPVADLIARRFELARDRLGYGPDPELDISRFRPPGSGGQMSLF